MVTIIVLTARSKLREVLFWHCDFFCLYMKYLGNRWTDMRQIHREDVFGPSLGRLWMSRSKVKGQGHYGQKRYFSALSAACVRLSLSLVKHL